MPATVILDAVRTPIGAYRGDLSSVRPDDLAAHVLRALLQRTGVDPAALDEVVLGCSNQAGEDNRNVARMASLLAGYPATVPGITVNRLCASGLDAIIYADRAIRALPVAAHSQDLRPRARRHPRGPQGCRADAQRAAPGARAKP